ncbi:MAG: FAD-dependent oxidoreductase, partial [Chloroflexota bacterium]|nr:FAD-dependent oxidoreductase [Chloroflexota bacterium]
ARERVGTLISASAEQDGPGGAAMRESRGMSVAYRSRTLPILREVDAVVVGGSFVGITAALRLARDGRAVTLVEPRTYLGREVTATLRPWVSLAEGTSTDDLPELVRACVEASGTWGLRTADEVPLHPDKTKLALEDALLGAGVSLLYGSLPVALDVDDDGPRGVVIGNKSGRQLLRGATVVDATETRLVARLAGGVVPPPAGAEARYSRTVEFDRVEPSDGTIIAVPSALGIAGNAVQLHQGYRGLAHVLVECPFVLGAAEGSIAATRREFTARRRTMRLASHLIASEPAFADARLTGSSWELYGPLVSPGEPSAAAFAGPVPGLWCAGDAHDDAVAAARQGEACVASLLLESGASPHPGASRHPSPNSGRRGMGERQAPLPILGERGLGSESWSAGPLSIAEPESPRRGWPYARRAVAAMDVPVVLETDVLVVGGGSSGATAAITAAREGVRTALLDLNPALGGTGTLGGVDSYWYGRHVGFAARLEGLVGELQTELRHPGAKWNIDAKMLVLQREAEAAGVETILNAVTIGAVRDGQRVRGVVAATRWGPVALLAEVVIDATGDGDVAAFAGADSVYGAARTHSVMWYSLAQFAAPGRIRNNFTSAVDVSNIEDVTRAILAGRRRGEEPHDHGVYVATRESRHIRGDLTLTLSDQLRHRQWPDVVNIHYSNHDIKGQTESDWLRAGLIPPNLEIEIPYRALLPAGLEGILVVGKAISATHDALPAIRMQADLENLGGVVALAAVQAIREGTVPRRIDICRLQERLIGEGLVPVDVLTRPVAERPPTDAELAAWIEALTGETPLYAYSDMHMGELFHERIPLVEVVSAESRAVPLLERAHAAATGPRRTLLAQALALAGSPAGVPTLVAAIEAGLAGEQVPARDSRIRHAGFPPDQGAMPDLAYLVYCLGMACDRRSLPVWGRLAALL